MTAEDRQVRGWVFSRDLGQDIPDSLAGKELQPVIVGRLAFVPRCPLERGDVREDEKVGVGFESRSDDVT
jgi:hypothetical protein